jgi:hypothetical protein
MTGVYRRPRRLECPVEAVYSHENARIQDAREMGVQWRGFV